MDAYQPLPLPAHQPATGLKRKMNYHIEFLTSDGRRFLFDG